MATPLIASLMQKAGGTAGIMGGARDAASDKKNDADSKNLESIKKSSNKLAQRGFITKHETINKTNGVRVWRYV